MTRAALLLAALALLTPARALAQVDGHVSVLFDVVPDLSAAPGSQAVTELRTRLFVERVQPAGERWTFTLGGYVDGLLADRAVTGGRAATRDAIVQPADLHVEYRGERFDVRAGFARVVWGRLDEFQPTDVVNPIDLTRFLLEGRSEARLPVGLVRGRVFLTEAASVELVAVPVFRASRFDQLDERSSPFNLAATPPGAFPVRREEPAAGLGHVQGGARFTTTTGRTDWGVSTYRGFRTFPEYSFDGRAVRETFTRFTMLGGDFETARGPWGLRGEAAWFGDSLEAGAGVDRRAGDYRVAGNVVISHEQNAGTGVRLVAFSDRTFARETLRLRVLGVYDPTDGTGFGRVTGALSVRDNVWVEASGGLFLGSAPSTIGLLTRRDFLFARLKAFF